MLPRKLLAVFLAFVVSAPSQALFRAQNVTTGGGGGSATLIGKSCQSLGSTGGTTGTPLNTTGANWIGGVLPWYTAASGVSAVTDNKSNGNATLLTISPAQNQVQSRIFYWENPTVGSGHTFTFTGTSAFAGICIEAWSLVNTSMTLDSGTDVICTGGSPHQTTTICQINTAIVPSSGKKLILFGWGAENTTGTCSIDSGMTIDAQIAEIGGTSFGGGVASIIQTPNGASIQPTITCPASSMPTASIAAFKLQ